MRTTRTAQSGPPAARAAGAMVTIADIAREVGVAPQVVSRVLHGGKSTAGARRELRERIREVAARRDYRPFAAGRMLRSRSFHSIGILLGQAHDFLISQQSLAGLVSRLAEDDYTGTVYYTSGTSDPELLDNRLITSKLCDALIIPYVRPPGQRLLAALAALAMPVIWMNRRARYDCVSMDETGAGALLADHLHERGQQAVTFVDYSGGGRDQHTRDRMRGLATRAAALGLQTSFVTEVVDRVHRPAAARALLTQRKRPHALIVNSLSAAQVILQTAVQLGLGIPEDLALASFDDGGHYSANIPFITCALRPEFLFGQVTGQLVLDRLKQPGRAQVSRRVPFELVVGGTTSA